MSTSPSEAAISIEQAAAELLRRQRARDSLVEYARSVDIPGTPANDDPLNEIFRPVETSLALHHRVMLEAIQRTVTTPNGRLMVFGPPGMAKSSYVSVLTPVWCLSKWPGYRIILASYATTIAEKQSRKARSLARDPNQQAIWPANGAGGKPVLAADQRAVGEWALSNGSEFMAAGLLAGITGNRADGVIIDDPVKNQEDADSQPLQDKTEEEYQSSVDSRLKPGAWIILIQTRWNENDLAGRLLPEDYAGQSGPVLCRDNQVWEVLNIPARAEHEDDPLQRQIGEYLWPEWFTPEHWAIREGNPRMKRVWAALYQQRPTSGDGIDFQREWFHQYDPDVSPGLPGGRPFKLTIYGASDFASKEPRQGEKLDYTEHGVMGMPQDFDFWFIDWWWGQKDSDVYIRQWVTMVRRWTPQRWWHEGGPIGNAIEPAMKSALRINKVYTRLDALTSIKSKTIKLMGFQERAASYTTHFPRGRPWTDHVIDQLLAFPGGKYDDAADVCGLLGRGVDKMMGAPQPQAPEARPSLRPFTQKWFEATDEPERKIRYT